MVLRFAGLAVALLLCAPGLPGAPPFVPEARAQQSVPACSLADAEARYEDGAFGEAVRLASRCLEEGNAAGDQARDARRLLILAHLQQGDRPAARAAAVALLQAAPGYEPRPEQDVPSYVAFVDEVKQELRAAGRLPPATSEPEQTPWFERRQTWLAVGGGLIVTGLLAIFVGG